MNLSCGVLARLLVAVVVGGVVDGLVDLGSWLRDRLGSWLRLNWVLKSLGGGVGAGQALAGGLVEAVKMLIKNLRFLGAISANQINSINLLNLPNSFNLLQI